MVPIPISFAMRVQYHDIERQTEIVTLSTSGVGDGVVVSEGSSSSTFGKKRVLFFSQPSRDQDVDAGLRQRFNHRSHACREHRVDVGKTSFAELRSGKSDRACVRCNGVMQHRPLEFNPGPEQRSARGRATLLNS